jgi:transcriptional/translational regulatory protein YebC/TACO1
VYVYTSFSDFAGLQKALEAKGIRATSAEMQRIPISTTELPEDKAKEVQDLIDRLEEDEDVQAVWHTMR